jgi:hypothetical protein
MRYPTQSPDATGCRPGDSEVRTEQTDSGAATEFVETDTSGAIHPSQDQLDRSVTFETLDLAKSESRIEQLADAGNAVLACEMIVGGGGEVSHSGSFPVRDDSRRESVVERYRWRGRTSPMRPQR